MITWLKSLFKRTDYAALVAQGAVIIDVRTASEFDGGHIKGARNIPVNVIGDRVKELKANNKPIICCCASGMRSGMAAGILKRGGIEAYNGGSWASLNNKL